MRDRDQLLSSKAAARKLGVHESRIRALAARDRLGARKVGGRWVIDSNALGRELQGSRERGRPYDPKNAFALLFMASDERPDWIRADVRSRLHRRLAEGSLMRDLPRLRGRARRVPLRAGESALRAIQKDRDFIRSGVSGALESGADISAPGVIEGYYPAAKLAALVYRYALREVDDAQANLIVHELSDPIPFGRRSRMPAAVVAVDLLEADDARSRRAGARLLRSIEAR
jgi:hypothetical protein